MKEEVLAPFHHFMDQALHNAHGTQFFWFIMLVLSVVISISKLVNEMNLICTGKQMSFLFDYAMIVTERLMQYLIVSLFCKCVDYVSFWLFSFEIYWNAFKNCKIIYMCTRLFMITILFNEKNLLILNELLF